MTCLGGKTWPGGGTEKILNCKVTDELNTKGGRWDDTDIANCECDVSVCVCVSEGVERGCMCVCVVGLGVGGKLNDK